MLFLTKKYLDLLDRALRHAAVVFMAVIFLVALLQVMIRYVSGIPMVWTEELARNLLVWMTFLLMGPALKAGLHYSVDYLISFLPFLGRVWLHRVADMITLSFGLLMLWIGIDFTVLTADARTAALEISTGWISSALPVGAVILCVYAIARLVVSFADPASIDDNQRQEMQL